MKWFQYLHCTEINHGTEEAPVKLLDKKRIPFSPENEELAKREAYNGEYEIIDDGEPEPEPTEQEQLRADVDFLLAMGGVL